MPTSHSFFSHRLKLHYVDWGNEGAPPVLLIHGSQDHCRSWDWVAQDLSPDYHVMALDLRGHGDSQWAIGGAYGGMEYIYDIVQFVRHKQLGPITLIAHSLGGTIALRYAGLYPDTIAGVVALEAVGEWDWRLVHETSTDALRNWVQSNQVTAARAPRSYASLEDAYARMHEQNDHLSEAQARHLTAHGTNQLEDGRYSWKFDPYSRHWPAFDIPIEATRALWQEISAPVLLINALQGYEHRVGQDDTLKYFKQASVVNVDEAGHWLHHDQLEACLGHTREFLRDLS